MQEKPGLFAGVNVFEKKKGIINYNDCGLPEKWWWLLWCLKMLGSVSGTVRKHGLVGGSLSCWVGLCFEIILLAAWETASSWLPSEWDGEISVPSLAPCVPVAAILTAMMTVDWTSEHVIPTPQLNVDHYKTCLGHEVSSQKWTP